MFDSNRNRNNILFKKEFDDWASINKNLKIIYTISEDDQHEQITDPLQMIGKESMEE